MFSATGERGRLLGWEGVILGPRISSLKGDVDLRDETPRAIADENASPGQGRGGLGVMAIAEEIEKWVVARSSR
jgi:hypothetical protein